MSRAPGHLMVLRLLLIFKIAGQGQPSYDFIRDHSCDSRAFSKIIFVNFSLVKDAIG